MGAGAAFWLLEGCALAVSFLNLKTLVLFDSFVQRQCSGVWRVVRWACPLGVESHYLVVFKQRHFFCYLEGCALGFSVLVQEPSLC